MFITSKLSSPVTYAFYQKSPSGINNIVDKITINGGADVINKRSLETPSGVVTELTDEQIEKLKSHPVFSEHLKNGYVAILGNEKEAKKADTELKEDNSKQLTPKDYAKKGKKAPKAK